MPAAAAASCVGFEFVDFLFLGLLVFYGAFLFFVSQRLKPVNRLVGAGDCALGPSLPAPLLLANFTAMLLPNQKSSHKSFFLFSFLLSAWPGPEARRCFWPLLCFFVKSFDFYSHEFTITATDFCFVLCSFLTFIPEVSVPKKEVK